MVGVDQVDAHLVLAGRYSGQVDCIDTTRVRPQPRQIVEVYVQMPDPWRYVERACAEHWYNVHVLDPILNPDDALGECRGKRGVYDQFGWRFVLDREVRCGTSLALCATASAASRAPPATAATVSPAIGMR